MITLTTRSWLTICLEGFVQAFGMSPGKIPFSDYSDAKRMAYRYLMGSLNEDMRPITKPPVPPHLRAASGNAITTAFMNETLKEGLYEVLADEDLRESWDRCFYELGVWSMVNPGRNDFERLRRFTEGIESSTMPPSETLTYLGQAYRAIGRTGTPEGKEFLRVRMTSEFWGDKMPQFETTNSAGGRAFDSAQREAIGASAVRGDEDAIAYLETLAQKAEFRDNPDLISAIRYQIDAASENRRVVEQDRAFYRLVRGESAPPSKKVPRALDASDDGRIQRLPGNARTPTPSPPAQAAISSPPITRASSTPAPTIERKAPIWPWVVGIVALVAIIVIALKRRA